MQYEVGAVVAAAVVSYVRTEVWSRPSPRTHAIGFTGSDVRARARIRDYSEPGIALSYE